jgi:hypothetical protein
VQTTGSNVTLVTNTQTLKLDITKKNNSWYGAIKLTYLYDTSPVEVEISFRSATDDVRWAIINGQKYINKITYTQDSTNTAHYTIGVEFAGTTYGCYQVDVIGDFAVVNSLTKDAFTGDKTAVYSSPWGKNNGVSLVSAPEDIGLTSPCTTVELVQAMRNKFNKTISSGAIGVFNNGGKTITDAPSDYGLLHIEVFGHDRVLIRYDGIGGSTYAGSWVGKIKGSNGTFSSITWEKPVLNPYDSNIYKTYGGIGELNSAKGTSINLESNVDNTQKIIDALGAREEFVEWYGNYNNRFGLNSVIYGNRINYLRIAKITNTNAIILAATSSGIVASRTYADGTLGDWTNPNKYSTTETVVGTWIDGKPIYRKSYSFEINDTFISKTLETMAIDNIIKVYGSYGGGKSLMRPVPYDGRTSQVDYSGANTSSSTEYSEIFYQASDTTLRFTAKSQSSMKKAVVVVEYTKA